LLPFAFAGRPSPSIAKDAFRDKATGNWLVTRSLEFNIGQATALPKSNIANRSFALTPTLAPFKSITDSPAVCRSSNSNWNKARSTLS
jgi:hypothetical protein